MHKGTQTHRVEMKKKKKEQKKSKTKQLNKHTEKGNNAADVHG